MKTVLITGIGGLTPRSIAGIIREKHSNYKIIGCDIEKKRLVFLLKDCWMNIMFVPDALNISLGLKSL